MRCKAGNIAVGETPLETVKVLVLQRTINWWVDSGRSRSAAVRVVPETGVLDWLTATSVHELLQDPGRADVFGPFRDDLLALGNDACALGQQLNAVLDEIEMAVGWWYEGMTQDRRVSRMQSLITQTAASTDKKKGRTWLWVVGGLAVAGVAVGAVVYTRRRRRRR